MESLVDVTTTAFQAILGVCVVFAAGYAYNTNQERELGKVSEMIRDISVNIADAQRSSVVYQGRYCCPL
jgi:hypothetical protein